MKNEYNQSQIELKAHIEAENAKAAAWVAEDPANRFSGMVTSNPDHWATYGIFTIEQYLFSMAKCAYSDSYKDVYGMRPDLSRFTTLAQVEAAQKSVDSEMKSSMYEEDIRHGEEFSKEMAAGFGWI
jgi:hypothetical protein